MVIYLHDMGDAAAAHDLRRLHNTRTLQQVIAVNGSNIRAALAAMPDARIPVVVSRNGTTAMGLEMAQRLGMALFGRASNRHFLCYSGFERFDAEPEPALPSVRVVAG